MQCLLSLAKPVLIKNPINQMIQKWISKQDLQLQRMFQLTNEYFLP